MLEEMKAYAEQALKINALEREVCRLNAELRTMQETHIAKEDAKAWFATIDKAYVFLTDQGKEDIRKKLGDK